MEACPLRSALGCSLAERERAGQPPPDLRCLPRSGHLPCHEKRGALGRRGRGRGAVGRRGKQGRCAPSPFHPGWPHNPPGPTSWASGAGATTKWSWCFGRAAAAASARRRWRRRRRCRPRRRARRVAARAAGCCLRHSSPPVHHALQWAGATWVACSGTGARPAAGAMPPLFPCYHTLRRCNTWCTSLLGTSCTCASTCATSSHSRAGRRLQRDQLRGACPGRPHRQQQTLQTAGSGCTLGGWSPATSAPRAAQGLRYAPSRQDSAPCHAHMRACRTGVQACTVIWVVQAALDGAPLPAPAAALWTAGQAGGGRVPSQLGRRAARGLTPEGGLPCLRRSALPAPAVPVPAPAACSGGGRSAMDSPL